ncbi:GFA family protein [Streptococcus loxodontisalivarius]|uniref:CENP-V/GFA domain-containing protein n=1 Tax=Streptococcus loxodontisalivarius TaxID=1349415 RepID=A0ABS2PS30_9STRE|nr:GFA family protein [Streptococcus loxodontisalivarius]MBM7642681.1 hypothetical protein [Streptococcus loxodontisalivarius]
MITGSCLCKGVTYEVTRLNGPIVFCHCSFCRKATSSAFSTNSLIDKEAFQLLSGKDLLATYESSPGKVRTYCRNCHSQIFHEKDDQAGLLTLKLGTIDSCDQDLSVMERKHIHQTENLPWLEE